MGIKKIIGAFLHAPERFDELANRIAEANEQRDALNRRMDCLMAELEDDIDRTRTRIEDAECRMESADQRFEGVDLRFDGVDLRIDGVESRIGGINIQWFMDQLCDDRELLSRLNRGLSISPTVWGDPSRLEIDETAAVFTCFFNTNSGIIRVGESTFAGSGVSLLAGSHDPRLAGFLRRDNALSEGCDIDIGKGVWLASGCTLLGPCEIGDNAVIAAGAVVTPGTKVPANTIWGGIPAKQIGTVDGKNMTPENPAVRRAFEHSEGMLYTDGWGEKTGGVFAHPGHRMYRREAGLITDSAEWKMEYRKEETGDSRLRIRGPEGEQEVLLAGAEGEAVVRLPIREGTLSAVTLEKDTDAPVFMAWSKPTGEEEPAPEAEEPEEIPVEESVPVEESCPENTKLDIERIMEEIRAEARKWAGSEDLPPFETMPKTDTRRAEKLKEEIRQLTADYVIPQTYADPSRNPLKRAYKKMAVRAVNCATAPMSVKMTETNLKLKTALEKAVEVIGEQEKRIAELERKTE